MATLMGKDAWWAVPAAVGIGVPMYANTAGVIPIVAGGVPDRAKISTWL